MFRRAPDGQWSIISPRIYGWTPLQSSSFALSDLRFGDFNADGITDVIALQGGHWSVSWGARSTWQPLNTTLSDSLGSVLITDIDGNGRDDVLRYVATSTISGRWDVSRDGRTGWQPLASQTWPVGLSPIAPAYSVFGLVGRFDTANSGDLLSVDYSRHSQIFSPATGGFTEYSTSAY